MGPNEKRAPQSLSYTVLPGVQAEQWGWGGVSCPAPSDSAGVHKAPRIQLALG